MSEKPVKKKKYTGSSKPLMEDAKKYDLSDKEIAFAQHYCSKEYFGNGLAAYSAAYNVDIANPSKYNAAKSAASRLLTKPNVLEYLNILFEHCGLNEATANTELLWCITQKADIHAKVAGLKLYYEITGKRRKQETTAIQFNINIEGGTGDNPQLLIE